MTNRVTLGAWEFAVGPESVSWSYEVKVEATPTLGGKVVQVLGVELSDMVMSGHFLDTASQQAFLDYVKTSIREQAATEIRPMRLVIPHLDLDFSVVISAVSDGKRSVHLDVRTTAPTYRLTMMIVEDHTNLTYVAENLFIDRIADEFGWEVGPFNSGNLTDAELRDYLGARGVGSVEELFALPINGEGVGGGYVPGGYGGSSQQARPSGGVPVNAR